MPVAKKLRLIDLKTIYIPWEPTIIHSITIHLIGSRMLLFHFPVAAPGISP